MQMSLNGLTRCTDQCIRMEYRNGMALRLATEVAPSCACDVTAAVTVGGCVQRWVAPTLTGVLRHDLHLEGEPRALSPQQGLQRGHRWCRGNLVVVRSEWPAWSRCRQLLGAKSLSRCGLSWAPQQGSSEGVEAVSHCARHVMPARRNAQRLPKRAARSVEWG